MAPRNCIHIGHSHRQTRKFKMPKEYAIANAFSPPQKTKSILCIVETKAVNLKRMKKAQLVTRGIFNCRNSSKFKACSS